MSNVSGNGNNLNTSSSGGQPRRYFSDQSRNYSSSHANWGSNPDFQRNYERKNQRNGYRGGYRAYDSNWQNSKHHDNESNGRRFEKDFRPPRFNDHYRYDGQKAEQQNQQLQPQQSYPKLSPEDQFKTDLENSIYIVSEQNRLNQLIGLYQAPYHDIEDPWD